MAYSAALRCYEEQYDALKAELQTLRAGGGLVAGERLGPYHYCATAPGRRPTRRTAPR